MNFIKKKLKSHKKDEEEEEYEKAVYEQSLHPQNQDQKMKNTEEWQFFQQLSMKVQDTVQKTQTTLNKLKDIRQDSMSNEEDMYDVDNELLSKDIPPTQFGTTKVLRAPPRPPPPSGATADLDFGTDFAQSSPAKGPPRPPPPGASDLSTLDSSALHGTPARSFGSPARPPPPTTKQENISALEDYLGSSDSILSAAKPTDQTSTSFSLLDEFGFQSDTTTTTTSNAQANFQDLLFLDDKEVDDPFDTSFVDVTNISSKTLASGKSDEMVNKSAENSFNPFSTSSVSTDWMASSPSQTDKAKKATNPFSLMMDASADKEQISSHNPFSSSEQASASNIQDDDLFSLSIVPLTDKTLIEDDPFKTPEQPVIEPLKNEDLLSDVFSIDNAVTIENELSTIQPVVASDSSTIQPISAIDNLKDIWDVEQKEDDRFFSEDTESKAETLDAAVTSPITSVNWDSNDAKKDAFQEKEVSVEATDEGLESETNMKDEVLDFFGNNNAAVPSESSINNGTKPTGMVESNTDEDILKPVSFDNISAVDVSASKENESSEFTADTFTSGIPLQEDNSQLSEMSDHQDMRSSGTEEKSNDITTAIPDLNQSYSKPFDEESETDAFLFKVKTVDEKPDFEFDAFAAKFESARENQESDAFDPFLTKRAPTLKKIQEEHKGFDSMDEFDPFKVIHKPGSVMKKEASRDSFEDYDNEMDFSVVIKPKVKDSSDIKPVAMEPPKLLPPPKTPTKAFESTAPRFNPFDKDSIDSSEQIAKASEKAFESVEEEPVPALGEAGIRKSESVETPLSPLFDEDTSQPLEIFPQPYDREGWEMVLRQPNKKKLTGNRFWKKIYVKLSENSVLQLFNKKEDKLPFQELPLQACYSLSEIGAQQYDQYGKIFTVKLQYKFYRERVGVRPGQISKVTQGQVTSMGDVAKLGLPLQHSPQTSQLLKLGSQFYKDIKLFIQEVEDALFRMVVHRDRVLTYKTEEVQVIAQDEFYVEQSKTGHIDKQLARVRIFFLAFITGMPSVEVGLNDINRQGKEVVGRYDIIPVVTEEWIRLEECEFHSCVIQDEFYKNRVIKFHPPDACLFELLRFRIRPPKNRELPLQVRVFMTVSSTRVEIRSDILVPGYSSRKQGQVPCENIQIRFPVPECWIYLFRTEKHFRYGSKKSAARRPGKIKGLERIIGAAQNLDPSLIEVSAGQAKYEHVFHAVVWRIPRLPKEGQGAYTQQLFLLRTELTSFDQIPETFDQYVDVEFTMPATYVSHTTVRSVSVTNPIPPEKYVRYISKHEYKVEIEFKSSSDDIDSLMPSPNVGVPVSTSPAVQESTEDEEKDDDSD